MAEYTGAEVVTLNTGDSLTGSTVANIDLIGNDAYARALTASNATLGDVTVSSGGTMYMRGGTAANLYVYGPRTVKNAAGNNVDNGSGGKLYISGGVVENLIVDQEGQAYLYNGTVRNAVLSKSVATVVSTAQLRIYGGTISGGSNNGFSELYCSGGTVSNFVMNPTMYAFVSTGATVVGGSYNGYWLAIRGGTVSGTVFKKAYNSAVVQHNRMSTGLMSDCTISAGASYTAIGGRAVDTVVSGANAMFLVSGANMNYSGGTVLSGGRLFGSVGNISKTVITSYGTAYVSGANVTGADLVVSGRSARLAVSGGGMVRGVTVTELGHVSVGNGGIVYDPVVSMNGATTVAGTYARLEVLSGGVVSGGSAGRDNYTVEVYIRPGATVRGMTFGSGAFVLCAGVAESCFMSRAGGQQVTIRQGGLLSGGTLFDGAKVTISSGTVSGVTVSNGGQIYNVVVAGQAANGLVKDVLVEKGGSVTLRNNGSGGALGQMSGGTVYGALYTSNNGVARNVTIGTGGVGYAYSNGNISGGTVYGTLNANNGGTVSGADIYGTLNANTGGTVIAARAESGALLRVYSGGVMSGAVVSNGGVMNVFSSGLASDTQVLSGGSLFVYSTSLALVKPIAEDGAYVSARLGSGNEVQRTAAVMDDASAFGATLVVEVANKTQTYTIASEVGNANLTVAAPWLMFDNAVKAGEIYVNPFLAGRGVFSVDAEGKTFTAATCNVTRVTAATSLAVNGDVTGTKWGATVNPNDRTAIWSGDKITGGVTTSVALAEGVAEGSVWLTTADALKIAAPLYGAAKGQNFANDVNIYFQGSTEVQNLAGGADYGGSVGGVNLFVSDATIFSGVAYVGGFGSVANGINIQISNSKSEFRKDLYAGALFNAPKLAALDYSVAATGVGSIDTIMSNGIFGGNVYGASAVKAGTISTTAATSPLHTVGDVSISLAGGSATNGKFCLFAGGYATGTDSAKAAAVYTVESVTATVSGGSWGSANGGRGIFGGIFASGVKAEAGEINLTVSGGTMGNVYGGGWSQKDGVSVVGDVELNITGGTMANVFGGGTHSTSGGATEAGNVTITVSGGTIDGDIYARGQLDGDTVANSTVIFAGNRNFSCGVYGYSYVGGGDSDATLEFSGYTGTFSGAIGGFDSVNFSGMTAMTLASADVSNTAWDFDLAERAESLAGTALLKWSAGALGENSTVAVAFADAAQARASWSIAAVADAAQATFGLTVGDDVVATGLAYNTAIADGDYAGWGFRLDNGTLKFANLA